MKAEHQQILPDLKPFEGLTIEHPLDILTQDELARVREELETLARNRLQSEASAGSIRLS